jgi:hypothetical protein
MVFAQAGLLVQFDDVAPRSGSALQSLEMMKLVNFQGFW